MDDLKALYFHIENPINNKTKWNEILNIYSSSLNYDDFYSKIVNKINDNNICYDEEDKKNFYLIIWSIWKQKLLSFTEDNLKVLIDKKEFDSSVYDVVKKLRELGSMKSFLSLRNALVDPDINRYFSLFFDDFNHSVVICSDFGIKRKIEYNTVLSVRVSAVNLYKLLRKLINECNDVFLPYYIRFNENGHSIELNIYTTVADVKRMEAVLSILKKENYTFFKNNNSNLLVGNIDEWLTIRNKDFYKESDYLSSRASILFKSIDSVMYEYVVRHLNTLVSYKDGRMNLVEYLATYVMEKVVANLISTNIRTNSEYFYIANSDDLLNLKNYIKNKLSLSMREILNDKIYLKDKDAKVEVQLNASKKIAVEADVFMCAIRNLVITLMLKDDSLEDMFKVRIKNECNYYKVDPDKFCLDSGFARKIFFNKIQYSNYQGVLDKIHSEVKKVNDLETLINSELNDDTRKQISSSMTELIEIFEEN
ncbi:MAG: hypothetical protein J6A52_00055 [Bacilli bacterium]|nr:hypothetical protein [Bacilli bacterium]